MTEEQARELLQGFLASQDLSPSGWDAREAAGLGWYFVRPGTYGNLAVAVANSRGVRDFAPSRVRPATVLHELNQIREN